MIVVALEGQTFAGKSSLARALTDLGVPSVNEYAELQSPLPSIPFESEANALASFETLLSLESARRDKLRMLSESSCVVTDRSIFSVLALHATHEALHLPSAWEVVLERLTEAIARDAVIIPHGLLVLDISEEVARAREKSRGHMVEFLMRVDVRHCMRQFYLSSGLGERSRVWHVSGESPAMELVRHFQEFRQRLAELPEDRPRVEIGKC